MGLEKLSNELLRYGGILDDYETYDHLYLPIRIRTIIYNDVMYNHYMRDGSVIKITELIKIN